jgi:hypothetical protein
MTNKEAKMRIITQSGTTFVFPFEKDIDVSNEAQFNQYTHLKIRRKHISFQSNIDGASFTAAQARQLAAALVKAAEAAEGRGIL